MIIKHENEMKMIMIMSIISVVLILRLSRQFFFIYKRYFKHLKHK